MRHRLGYCRRIFNGKKIDLANVNRRQATQLRKEAEIKKDNSALAIEWAMKAEFFAEEAIYAFDRHDVAERDRFNHDSARALEK
jgi:hypothetical protein